MRDKKDPRFFCDSCGLPVQSGSSSCPHCGSTFSGVRCPACGFQGKESEFKKGCPNCGFLPSEDANRREGSGIRSPIDRRKNSSGMPDWFFKTALILLLAIIGGLMFIFGMRFI